MTERPEVWNVSSWNDMVHLLVVDQPVGTGYSYAPDNELVNTTEEAAEALW